MRFNYFMQIGLGMLFAMLSVLNLQATILHFDLKKYSVQDSLLAKQLTKSSVARLTVDAENFRAFEILATEWINDSNTKRTELILEKLINYANSSSNNLLLSNSLHKLGFLNALNQNIELAYKYYTQAAQIDSIEGAFYGVSLNKLNIAELKMQIGDFSSAYNYLQDIQGYFEFTKDSLKLTYTQLLKAQILFELQRDKSAYICLKEAKQVFPEGAKNTSDLHYVFSLALAHNFLHLQEFDSVKFYLNQALETEITSSLMWLKPYENYLNFQYLKRTTTIGASVQTINALETQLMALPPSVWNMKVYDEILKLYAKQVSTEKQLEFVQLKNNNALELLTLIHKTQLIDKEGSWRRQNADSKVDSTSGTNYWIYIILIVLTLLALVAFYAYSRMIRSKHEEIATDYNERLTKHTKSQKDLTSAFSLKNRVIVLLSNEVSTMIQETQNALSLIKSKTTDSFVNEVIMPDLSNTLNVHQTQLLGVAAWVKNNLNSKELKLSTIDLSLALTEVLQALNYDVSKRSIQIHNHLPKLFSVNGDFEAYKIILFNLIQFMVHQSVNGAEITIQASAASGKSYITISDNGFGLTVVQLENLFALEQRGNKHEQIDNLNLLIATDLAKLMFATISASSKEMSGLTLQLEINA